MHGVLVNVTINNPEQAVTRLRDEIVPRVSSAPGFVAGYWLRSDDGSRGTSVIVFESEENANAAVEMIRQQVDSDDVTLENVEAREVVASA
jgi:hypothetical protein